MRPDFDDQLHALLEQTARDIPDSASVIPALRARLTASSASQPHQKRTVALMHTLQRLVMPVAAALLVVALAVTLILFHPLTPHSRTGAATKQLAATATVAATMPPIPFVPKQVTSNGIIVQFDGFDSTPIGTSVRYHTVTQPPASGDYAFLEFSLTDQQHQQYACMACGMGSHDTQVNALVEEEDFAPLPPTHTETTLTFSLTQIRFIPSEGTPITQAYTIKGNWSMTQTMAPQFDGATQLSTTGVTAGGVTLTPQLAEWLNESATKNRSGVRLQIAVKGLPTSAADGGIGMPYRYYEVVGGSAGNDIESHAVQLKILNGQPFAPPSLFAISSSVKVIHTQYDSNMPAMGTITPDGTATVEIAFQNVQVKPGDTLTLTIHTLVLTSAGTSLAPATTISGDWTLNITL